MPKTTLNYPSLESIPTGLQAFATKVSDTQFTVEVFYGGEETVAKETNPGTFGKNLFKGNAVGFRYRHRNKGRW